MRLLESFLQVVRIGEVITVDRMLRDGMLVDVSNWADLVWSGQSLNVTSQTALHIATCNGRNDVVKYLVHEGADVNRQTGYKDTSLHLAAQFNNTEVARLLRENGADINLKKIGNETPLDCTRKGSEVQRVLLQLQQIAP